ncbi:hypothetical protein HBB16_18420 [Pseudonocardia sp. MCCB 268]|nr:hypothetical protein [Pseudonocardia cytotoxica]
MAHTHDRAAAPGPTDAGPARNLLDPSAAALTLDRAAACRRTHGRIRTIPQQRDPRRADPAAGRHRPAAVCLRAPGGDARAPPAGHRLAALRRACPWRCSAEGAERPRTRWRGCRAAAADRLLTADRSSSPGRHARRRPGAGGSVLIDSWRGRSARFSPGAARAR